MRTNPVIVGMVMLVIGVTMVMLEDNNCKAGELVNPDRLEKATSSPTIGEWHGVVEVSAYNTMESQTDSTPTITASGDTVYEGGIASNCYSGNCC